MAVYRVNKDRSYTVMANFHLRDKNLSLKAVGLLSKMLSFNDGWKFSTRGLSAICKEGPDAIHSALRELEKHTPISFRLRGCFLRLLNFLHELLESFFQHFAGDLAALDSDSNNFGIYFILHGDLLSETSRGLSRS